MVHLSDANRSYSLDYTPRHTRTPTRPAASSATTIDTSSPSSASSIGTSERELSVGKHKRFAYNPETKRMEIVMVSSSVDGSPA